MHGFRNRLKKRVRNYFDHNNPFMDLILLLEKSPPLVFSDKKLDLLDFHDIADHSDAVGSKASQLGKVQYTLFSHGSPARVPSGFVIPFCCYVDRINIIDVCLLC